MADALAAWHRIVTDNDPAGLEALLAEDAIFQSPVVHTPKVGRAKALTYLRAALKLLNNGSFRYVGEWHARNSAVLEFEVTLDGILANGVDIIRWNDAGEITHFKVMVRPLKGMEKLREGMAALLAAYAR